MLANDEIGLDAVLILRRPPAFADACALIGTQIARREAPRGESR